MCSIVVSFIENNHGLRVAAQSCFATNDAITCEGFKLLFWL